MASGYAAMELQAQVDLMRQENAVAGAVTAKAQMWKAAQSELGQAGESMGKATDAVEPHWTDQAGTTFVANTRDAKSVVDTWVRNIESSKPDAALDAVAKGIGDTLKIVEENQRKAQQALAQATAAGGDAAALKEQIEKPFREANGQAMDSLDTLWDAAANAVRGAAGGAGQQQALSSSGGGGGGGSAGGPGGGGGQGQQAAGGAQAQQGAGAQQGADAAAGAQQGAGGGAAAQDPSLSGGLGTAPTAPPPTVAPSVPPTVAPVVPPTVPPSVPPGAGVVPLLPGTGVSPGRGNVIPGVSVGGSGQSSIPAASAPVSGPGVPTAGTAPAGPAAATPATSGTPVGGGAIPPMVPPMGAGMAGGRGGGTGSGAVTRPGPARRRDGRTPGLPAVLSGKAGKANPDAFAVRRRTAAESDVPTTVQLIDEDLWQVEQAPVMDQPPRRVR